MKKMYPDMEDVPQSIATRAARIVEKRLRQEQVSRARDLSEESRVRMYRELRAFFDEELRTKNGGERSNRNREGLWTRFLKRLEDFMSFGDWSPNVYLPLWSCASATYCDGVRQPLVAIRRATTGPNEDQRSGE
ncbi:MAG: hypothetical protein Q7N50_07290 [Armatimonadota bacterium]|nr:hypothetical protein [Armatimonadota bacterium]